jgi:RNA polymerase sigma-70 factor (ECF subfamily)
MDISRAPPAEIEARLEALIGRGALAEAATAIVRSYGPGILGYLAALLRDDDAAREAFSEFAEELWRSLPRFAKKSSVKTWAYAIAYHSALRQRRARARRRMRPLRDSEYSKIAASAEATSRSFARTAADRKLDALRKSLTDEEQTLLVLRVDRRMPWEEIAEVLGVSRARVPLLRKRFQRLKERLKQAARREGLLSVPEGDPT